MNNILNELCKMKGVSRTQVNKEFIFTLEELIKQGSLDFGYGVLFKKARENVAGGVREDITKFDVSLLETSGIKSGFTGVYIYGKRWRAQVPDPARGGIPRPLNPRDTPVEAAIDRFRWYEEHALPYGNIGLNFENWRTRQPELPVEEIFKLMLAEHSTGGLKKPYTLDELHRFMARWREKNPQKEPAFADSSLPRSTAADVDAAEPPPAEVLCSICSKPIEHDYELRFYKETEWRHRNCREPRVDN